MERLRGKIILFGKEPGQGRLLVAIAGNGRYATIGAPGSVPNCVSRCRPTEGVAHARLSVSQNGTMTLENIKPQNVTYVNGSEIVAKQVTTANTVELGKDRFRINLSVILEAASKIVVRPPQPVPPQPRPQPLPAKKYNISHLEYIWASHQEMKRIVQSRQRRITMVRSGCGIFTTSAMLCCFLIGPVGYVLTGIGLLGNIYSFVGLKNDHTAETVEQFNEEFQDRYVCPNPDCNKFLGNISYRLLKKQYSMHCPYCKSEYVEK